MTLIQVEPDGITERVFCVGSFDVDADMPRQFVRERIYPAMRAKWLAAMRAQGYTLSGSHVYFFPKDYAVVAAPDSGEAGTGDYEHDPRKRSRVNRKMGAFFLRRAVRTEAQVD